MVDSYEQMYGSYSPLIMKQYASTGTELTKLSSHSYIVKGCDNTFCKNYKSSSVRSAVSKTDFTIVFLGTGPAVETEGQDRPDMSLPGYQEQLLKDVVYAGRFPFDKINTRLELNY